MALFNHLFPYSNLHDINLDWIISIIKSIDPAVIQALQELTPDIIEQVNQKVSEAQAAAIAAQSSASEANTARENASTSATEAAQDATAAAADAVRAENAKIAVENSLNTTNIRIVTPSEYTAALTYTNVSKTGKTVIMSISGTFAEHEKSTEYWTPVLTIPDIDVFGNEFVFSGVINGATKDFAIRNNNVLCVVTNALTGQTGQYFNVAIALPLK